MKVTCLTLLLLTSLSQGIFGLPTTSLGDKNDKATLSLEDKDPKEIEPLSEAGVRTGNETTFSEIQFDIYNQNHPTWSITNAEVVSKGGPNPTFTMTTSTTGNGVVYLDRVSHVPTFATGTGSIQAQGLDVQGAVEHFKDVLTPEIVVDLPTPFNFAYLNGLRRKDSLHQVEELATKH